MNLKITNQEILNISELLTVVSASGKEARAVAKFSKRLGEKNNEYHEFLGEIVNKYSESIEDNQVIWKKECTQQANKEYAELLSEVETIDLTEFETHKDNLISALYNSDAKLSGQQLIIFDELLDKLEDQAAD